MKKILVSLGILVLALSIVGIAAGGGGGGRDLVKVPLVKFTSTAPGYPFTSGTLVLNGGKEKVSIDVEVKGVKADFQYTVYLEVIYGLTGWYYVEVGKLDTDAYGNGRLETSYPFPAGNYILGIDVADWAGPAEFVSDSNKNGVWDGAADLRSDVTVDPGTGFDQFGYNYNARIFVGKADGVDRVLDGKVWGDPMYANDNLVMKWNEAWDLCNDHGNNDVTYCLGAWTSNEWNGMMPDGTQSVWHYKIIWVGATGRSSPYWRDGGYVVWNNYEVIMDQGVDPTGHAVYAHAIPNGYGA